MKKITLLLAIIFIYTTTLSQSCLPEGITFSTQAQIDNFHIDYPGCTEIEGNVLIQGEFITSINNLNGLIVLTTIGGDISISHNDNLGSLTGLDNVTSIEGYFSIFDNTALTSLTGLDNLISVGYLYIFGTAIINMTGLSSLETIVAGFQIESNQSMTSLTGLDNLITIENYLGILNNDALLNLSGLDNVTIDGGMLMVSQNDALINLTGLENVSTIESHLIVMDNISLTSLTGLDNLITIGGNLTITNNTLLSMCEIQSICDYLVSPGGGVNIHDNASGCNSAEEIEALCPACPENIEFTTQSQIDNFQTDYPGCTEIVGDVIIQGEFINNLNGLNILTSIGGMLGIRFNANLESLTGLDNLITIGAISIAFNAALINLSGLSSLETTGRLGLQGNNNMTSLTGLDNLTSVGGDIDIRLNDALLNLSGLDNVTIVGGMLYVATNDALINLTGLENVLTIESHLLVVDNTSLTSLTALDNLTSVGGDIEILHNTLVTDLSGLSNLVSIGGDMKIRDNDALLNLSGLDNLITIGANLTITNNTLLSICEVQSICDYLASPGGEINIHDNAPGCNTQEEVIALCAVGISDIHAESFTIYPNPASNEIYISAIKGTIINEVNIYNQLGQKVLHQQRVSNSIDVSMLQPGIYVIEVVSNKFKLLEKLIIK